MILDVNDIREYISKIPFVKQIHRIEQGEFYIHGNVEILFDELGSPLNFEFEIAPQYPLKSYESESIKFRNKDLISYKHVMSAGNICIHTSHSTDIEQKLNIDFTSLKNWIVKYYINKAKDSNYEHIIVNANPINDQYYAYCFTDCEGNFNNGEYGVVSLSFLKSGIYKEKTILNFIIQGFTSVENNDKVCQWSNIYKKCKEVKNGFYYFIEDTPATHNKFAFKYWSDLANLLPTEFLNSLYEYEKQNLKKFKGTIIPLFLGYRINKSETHWQVTMLEIGNFPLEGVPEKINGRKTGKWNSALLDEEIAWGLTRNTSYRYFFGRGTFGRQLTDKKILIIGVGAVGSMIAKTLTRGGCKDLDFIDYDIKEPENVCRSEYSFSNGITDKTDELTAILSEISPFVNVKPLNNDYFEILIKTYRNNRKYREKFTREINNYDLIFDCSTDNDLMFVLNSLELDTVLINISITNHANELVCAFYPNIYRFVNNQFSNVLKNDVDDLYSPTGCWSPTFKASYNDINVLVQLALRHINIMFQKGTQRNNFVIQEDKVSTGNLKIVEF